MWGMGFVAESDTQSVSQIIGPQHQKSEKNTRLVGLVANLLQRSRGTKNFPGCQPRPSSLLWHSLLLRIIPLPITLVVVVVVVVVLHFCGSCCVAFTQWAGKDHPEVRRTTARWYPKPSSW
jgi:hypothetical protein